MRTIEQIDQAIDANRNAMKARLHFDPSMSSFSWQTAWDRCPDLWKRDRELHSERFEAMEVRDRQAELERRRQERAARSAAKKSAKSLQRCPTCGALALAA